MLSDPESGHVLRLKFLKFLNNLIKNLEFLLFVNFILEFLYNLILFS